MYKELVAAEYVGGYQISLKFEDGAEGTVDFSGYLSKGGVFEKFKDLDFFQKFKINQDFGVLTWADEIDIAPETLYAVATGTTLPGWMRPAEPAASQAWHSR